VLVASSNFLIPNWTFVAELLIFLIVLGVMARVVLPPLGRSVAERADGIKRSVHRADSLRGGAARLTAERRTLLAEARLDAREEVDHAIRQAEEERRAAQDRGHAEYNRLLAEATSAISRERVMARQGMRTNLPALIAAAAERVIGTQVDIHKHSEVVADAMRAVEEVA
jgi:F-type H+-transporting ATPase subunit b